MGVDSGDLADHDGESAANTSDFSESEWKHSLSTDVRVVNTNNVPEVIRFFQNEALFPPNHSKKSLFW